MSNRVSSRAVTALALAVTLVVSLGACARDDEAAAREAISQAVLASNDDTFSVSQDEAECVGEGWVDRIGVDRLDRYGVLTEDLEASERGLEGVAMSRQDAAAAAEVMTRCTDVKAMFLASTPGETRPCVADRLDGSVLHAFLVAVLMDRQAEGAEQLRGDLEECLAAG